MTLNNTVQTVVTATGTELKYGTLYKTKAEMAEAWLAKQNLDIRLLNGL